MRNVKKQLSREEFELHFKEVNASMIYEDEGLNDKEKELLYQRMSGKITDEEYNKACMEAGKGE